MLIWIIYIFRSIPVRQRRSTNSWCRLRITTYQTHYAWSIWVRCSTRLPSRRSGRQLSWDSSNEPYSMRHPRIVRPAAVVYDPRPPRLRPQLRHRLRSRLRHRLKHSLRPSARPSLQLSLRLNLRPSLRLSPRQRPTLVPANENNAGCRASQAKACAGCGPTGVNLFININMLLIFKIFHCIKILSNLKGVEQCLIYYILNKLTL